MELPSVWLMSRGGDSFLRCIIVFAAGFDTSLGNEYNKV